MPINPLELKDIDNRCKPEIFDFKTTEEIEKKFEIFGQDRAIKSIDFATEIDNNKYNIFVMGPGGLGKHEIVKTLLNEKAKTKNPPNDICYVNNFSQINKPISILLPPGRGIEFKKDMKNLIETLKSAIPAAFESEEYNARKKMIEEEYKNRSEFLYKNLENEARSMGIAVVKTPVGIMFVPLKSDGQLMKPEEFQALDPQIKEEFEKKLDILNDRLNDITRELALFRKESVNKLKKLNEETTHLIAGHLIEELKNKYKDNKKIEKYLDDVEKDVVEHLQDFLFKEESGVSMPFVFYTLVRPSFKRYEVNVLISHENTQNAPVIYEDNPTYENLIGRIEHIAQMGTLITDFTLIRPGALHKANGGYLIIDARKVLIEPFAWESLKRALLSKKIKIVPKERMIGLISTLTLEPEPIDLDTKIILIGNRIIYYLLYNLDNDFKELFKVVADFNEIYEKDKNTLNIYANYIASFAKHENLMPLSNKAIAKIIDVSSRFAQDSKKLSLKIKKLQEIIQEANYWAKKREAKIIDDIDIKKAVDEKEYRSSRIKELINEEFGRDILKIDISGEKIGQINGLSVIDLGDISFAKPTKITATVRMGKGELIDIEKEAELGGKIYTKSTMIIAGFLKGRYLPDIPLTLSASLVFEQSYSFVEGDSASLAETCALLSAISQIPLKQNIAITGSISQKGEVQAIGGVNEKIEGFYEICKIKGFTKDQGVIIPKSNIEHLILKDEIYEKIEKKEFFIYSVENIDEAIEILTGLNAGVREKDGKFTKDSFNAIVEEKLENFAKKAKEFFKEK
ncbi:Lon protease family protein [Nitrosophilus kaiyonis]|uniref:Lon protease family protein n=1 Tax=Nitrosophilus kaiyonis TaxID=2930200 RepID=UPI002493C0AF|nr:ATP-binding protein [Nitrosophilus kaiyonis]